MVSIAGKTADIQLIDHVLLKNLERVWTGEAATCIPRKSILPATMCHFYCTKGLCFLHSHLCMVRLSNLKTEKWKNTTLAKNFKKNKVVSCEGCLLWIAGSHVGRLAEVSTVLWTPFWALGFQWWIKQTKPGGDVQNRLQVERIVGAHLRQEEFYSVFLSKNACYAGLKKRKWKIKCSKTFGIVSLNL